MHTVILHAWHSGFQSHVHKTSIERSYMKNRHCKSWISFVLRSDLPSMVKKRTEKKTKKAAGSAGHWTTFDMVRAFEQNHLFQMHIIFFLIYAPPSLVIISDNLSPHIFSHFHFLFVSQHISWSHILLPLCFKALLTQESINSDKGSFIRKCILIKTM